MSLENQLRQWGSEIQNLCPPPLPQGLDAWYYRFGGFLSRVVPRKRLLMIRAGGIIKMEKVISELSDADIQAQLLDLRYIFRCHKETRSDLNRLLPLFARSAKESRA